MQKYMLYKLWSTYFKILIKNNKNKENENNRTS